MPRATKGAARTKSRNRTLREARGYFGSRSTQYYVARDQIIRSGCYAFRDRRQRKRDLRSLWITRITAACRMRATRYSLFMNGLARSGVILNRKMLSQVAIEDPKLFDRLAEMAVKAATPQPAKRG